MYVNRPSYFRDVEIRFPADLEESDEEDEEIIDGLNLNSGKGPTFQNYGTALSDTRRLDFVNDRTVRWIVELPRGRVEFLDAFRPDDRNDHTNRPVQRTDDRGDRTSRPVQRIDDRDDRTSRPVQRIDDRNERTSRPVRRTVDRYERTSRPIRRTEDCNDRTSRPVRRMVDVDSDADFNAYFDADLDVDVDADFDAYSPERRRSLRGRRMEYRESNDFLLCVTCKRQTVFRCDGTAIGRAQCIVESNSAVGKPKRRKVMPGERLKRRERISFVLCASCMRNNVRAERQAARYARRGHVGRSRAYQRAEIRRAPGSEVRTPRSHAVRFLTNSYNTQPVRRYRVV